MWTTWRSLQGLEASRGADVCCPPSSAERWASLLPADGPLQTLDGRLERTVLLDPALGDRRRMDHGRMVTSEELADVGERRVHEAPAEVHRHLPRHRDVLAPAFRVEVGRA